MTTVNDIKISADKSKLLEIEAFLKNEDYNGNTLVLDFSKVRLHNRFHELPISEWTVDENGSSILWYAADTNSEPLYYELTRLAEEFPDAKIELIYEGSDVGYYMWHNGSLNANFVLDLEDMEEYDMDDLWAEVQRLELDVVN